MLMSFLPSDQRDLFSSHGFAAISFIARESIFFPVSFGDIQMSITRHCILNNGKLGKQLWKPKIFSVPQFQNFILLIIQYMNLLIQCQQIAYEPLESQSSLIILDDKNSHKN